MSKADLRLFRRIYHEAQWQSGYAAVCKTVDIGSIPVWASIFSTHICSPLHLLSQFGVCLAGFTFCKT